jgi:hypothetical protein
MPLRLRAKLATTIGTMVLVGCTACPRDDHCASLVANRTASSPLRAQAVAARTPRVARPAKLETGSVAHQEAGPLTPRNQAKFMLSPGMEVVGRSRSYTGEQLDPNTCAEQCLVDTGCDAFAFDIDTKLCYRVGQITGSNPNPTFVSGTLKREQGATKRSK